MSPDDPIRDGLHRLAAPVDDPHGTLERVLASSRRRTRRRRTFGVLMAAVLLGAGLALAASGDDAPRTEVAGEVELATTTSAPTSTAPATTAAVAPTATSSTSLVCAAPVLPTALPEGFATALVATPDGSWLVRAGDRTIAMGPGAAAATRPATGVRSVAVAELAATAAVFTADGTTVADLTLPQGRCGTQLHVVARGLTDAEIDTFLRGLRPEAACSAVGTASTPGPQGELPAPVAAMRAKLRDAAAACDFETLAALVSVNPAFVAEVKGVRLADQWRLEDARGNRIMRAVVGLLDLAPRRADAGISAGAASYVWPGFAAAAPGTAMTDAELASLDRVYVPGYAESFRNGFRRSFLGAAADTYAGGIYVEIRADGVPAAITTR